MQPRPDWPKRDTPPNLSHMAIDPIQPPVYPVTSAPGATAGVRATVGVEPPELRAARWTDPPADLLAEPPQSALAAVQVAAEAYETLRRSGRELRFERADGIVRIEVYDGTGRLVRSIPPNEALAMASGETSWQA